MKKSNIRSQEAVKGDFAMTNDKAQMPNKVQMSKFKGHTAGLGARDGGAQLEISRDTLEIGV